MTMSYRQLALAASRAASPMDEISAWIFRKPPIRPLPQVMFTGVTHKIGTSFVARNLAELFKSNATRVLIVEVLAGRCQPNELTRLIEARPDVTVFDRPITTLHLGIAEFMRLIALGQKDFDRVSLCLAKHFDLAIWDMPPPEMAMPTAIAASLMDGVVLIVETGRTSRRAARYVSNILRDSDGQLFGVVMNRSRCRSIERNLE